MYTVLDLKEQINQAENSLALLLAETPHKIQRGKLGNQQLPENFSVGVPLQMLANRPDVRSAEFSLHRLSIPRMPPVPLSILPSR